MRACRGVTASAGKVGPLLVGIVLVALAGVSARGQSASPTLRAPQFPQVYDWRQTAQLEHEDRKQRFARLAAQGLIATPEFYEALISKTDLLQFGVDLPVLRIVFPQRVFFDTDKAQIRPDAIPIIDLIAEDLRHDVPDVAVFIAGHTDCKYPPAKPGALECEPLKAVGGVADAAP
jgi:outer membrane protein OmpA-like peptidoglycan-associated protein